MELLVINDYKTVCDVDLSMTKLVGNGWKLAEVEAGKIMRNKQLRRKVAFMIALGMMLSLEPTWWVFASTSGITSLGMKFWGYVKVFARYGCMVMGGIEVVKNLNSGDAKSISKVLFKYILAYAVVVLMPWIFDEIDIAVSTK